MIKTMRNSRIEVWPAKYMNVPVIRDKNDVDAIIVQAEPAPATEKTNCLVEVISPWDYEKEIAEKTNRGNFSCCLPMVLVASGAMPAEDEECIVLTSSGERFCCNYQNGKFGNREFEIKLGKLISSKWENITGVIAWMAMPGTPKVSAE